MVGSILGYAYVFLVQYFVPLIFAIGLIIFFYSCINYYIIGPGEEPKREEGRKQMLWAFLIFLIGMVIYGIVAVIIWFGTLTANINSDIEAGEEVRLQRVPDVPRENN